MRADFTAGLTGSARRAPFKTGWGNSAPLSRSKKHLLLLMEGVNFLVWYFLPTTGCARNLV